MATIKVEVTYDPKKETLSQALASLLTEKPEHTEITAQMSLFDNPAPTETPTAQTSTEAPQESPAESASEAPDTKPTEEKTISNILRQVCLPFYFAWVGLSVVAIVFDDYLRYWFFGEEKPHYKIV